MKKLKEKLKDFWEICVAGFVCVLILAIIVGLWYLDNVRFIH